MANSEPIDFTNLLHQGQAETQIPLFADFDPPLHTPRSEIRQEKAPLFYVNHLQCILVRDHFQLATQLSKARPHRSLTDQSPSRQLRALIYLISICDRLNWDFTLGPLAQELSRITHDFQSDAVLALSRTAFKRAFGSYRRPDETIKFSHKFRTLQLVARHVLKDDPVPRLMHASSVRGSKGAQVIIDAIPGYSADPIKKKSNALLHEIVRRKLITFADADTIEPAVDYHIMRLYLRTGRVEIRDPALARRLTHRGRVRIERITEIRRTVAEAIRYAAWVNHMSVSKLNDLEWLFARRACRRDGVWCFRNTNCPLQTVCPSANQNPIGMVTEPESRHGYY